MARSRSTATAKLLVIAALTLALVAALIGRMWLPQPWLAPMVATVLFAAAAAAALYASRLDAASGARIGWLDIAGIITCIGIVLTLLIEPEDTIQFVQGMTRRD